MDYKVIGEFIASLRKAKGMTQQNLADELHVSNRTVSKWERGEGIPEISTLIVLAEIFNISVEELIAGRRLESHQTTESKKQIKYLINKKIKNYGNLILISRLSMIIGYILLLTIGYATFRSIWSSGITSIIYVISIGIMIIANTQLSTFINMDEQISELDKIKLKYKYNINTFYTLLLLIGLIILSLPIIIYSDAYSILSSSYYLESVPYLLLLIVVIYIIAHIVFQYIMAIKGYIKVVKINIIRSILIIITFIVPFIVNSFLPIYTLSNNVEKISYFNNEPACLNIINWKDFYENYYVTSKYKITKIDGEKYYQYDKSKQLPVKDGKKYIHIFENMKSAYFTNNQCYVTYYPLIKEPITLSYYGVVLIIEYTLIGATWGIIKLIKNKKRV